MPVARAKSPVSTISPTGSGSDATCLTPSAIRAILPASSDRRSNMGPDSPDFSAAAKSDAFAEIIAPAPSASLRARISSAAFFFSDGTFANFKAARRASAAISDTLFILSSLLIKKFLRAQHCAPRPQIFVIFLM